MASGRRNAGRSGLARLGGWLLRLALTAAGAVALVVLVRAFDSLRFPDLQAWHRVHLEREFDAGDADTVASVEAYRVLEDRVFEELADRIERDVPEREGGRFSRFAPASASHPDRFGRNWNRSFELTPPTVRGGALLLHGLTDSPYSLRSVAALLAAQGFYTLALRLPGHGTHPGGLVDARYPDWQAVARLGARHVRSRIGDDAPFAVVGYSMGGALAIDYVLEALAAPGLPLPDRVVLLSPAVGVSAAGVVGSWHRVLSFLPAFEKFRWLEVLPEYDPFKYNSFPKNAGRQMYLLTRVVADALARARNAGRLVRFPPTLTFQSVADGTVSTRAVLDPFYASLGSPRHALVLFDVNRTAQMNGFLDPNCHAIVSELEAKPPPGYRLTLLTNARPESREVVARELGTRDRIPPVSETGLVWPPDVYSLSHVALPFRSDDPLYGVDPVGDGFRGIRIGAVTPRGERDLLTVSMSQVMRLRYNPFHAYVAQRIRSWLAPEAR
jgi:alpha-beta hydrolase superfamily lysophospholipase